LNSTRHNLSQYSKNEDVEWLKNMNLNELVSQYIAKDVRKETVVSEADINLSMPTSNGELTSSVDNSMGEVERQSICDR
jgi:hypothetical protein